MESFPRSPEFSSDSTETKSEKDSKKEKKIGGKVAETLIKPPAEVKERSLEPQNAESIWQRIAALAEKREIDKSILKPVENADNDSKLDAKKHASPAQDDQERISDLQGAETATLTDDRESEQSEDRAPLETLSREEEQETVRRYAENRRLELEEELHELPEGAAVPVESAADLAFLQYVEEQFAEKPDLPVAETLGSAAETVVERIKSEPHEAPADDQLEPADAETNEEAEPPQEEPSEGETLPDGAAEGEIPLHGPPSGAEDDPVIIDPATHSGPTAAGGGGGGNGTVPPAPPSPPGSTPPPSGGYPQGSGQTGQPPYGYASAQPGYNAYNYAGAPYANAAPNPNGVSYDELSIVRRRAMAQGLLVGGIIGYLIGRRRGRIKTEKRLLPVQKKLEKQVKSLTEKVAFQEKRIRTQARETAEQLKESERRRLAERLLAPAVATGTVATIHESARGADRRTLVAETAPRTAVEHTSRHAPETFYDDGSEQAPHASELHAGRQQIAPERLGRFLVEAPAVVALDATHARKSEQPAAIDFHKKVEDYSPAELHNAAEKIRIDGVTLREVRNTHHLDEKAVRRIVTAFVEGKNVREALDRELFAREARYERDPHLRTEGFGGPASSGGTGAGSGTNRAAAAVIGLSGHADRTPDGAAAKKATINRPQTLGEQAAEYRKQAAELGVGIVVLILIALVIARLLH